MYEFREVREVYVANSCDDRKGRQTASSLQGDYDKLSEVLDSRRKFLLATGFVENDTTLVRSSADSIETVLLEIKEKVFSKPVGGRRVSWFD